MLFTMHASHVLQLLKSCTLYDIGHGNVMQPANAKLIYNLLTYPCQVD